MTRFLTITGAAVLLALPVATSAFACGARETIASAEATSVDLAAAAKKAFAPAVKQDKTDATQTAPAK
jgi:hypothetical protein